MHSHFTSLNIRIFIRSYYAPTPGEPIVLRHPCDDQLIKYLLLVFKSCHRLHYIHLQSNIFMQSTGGVLFDVPLLQAER